MMNGCATTARKIWKRNPRNSMTNSINSKVLELQREIPNVSGITIIVEGKKDRKPLEKLGFQNIQEISGKPLNEIFEEVAAKNPEYVAILTD